MTRATDISYGWSLYAEWADRGYSRSEMNVQFRHRDGRRRNPLEFASVSEARQVFHDLKRLLDVSDYTERVPLVEFRQAALERSKLALQLALQCVGRWSDELLETGIEATPP